MLMKMLLATNCGIMGRNKELRIQCLDSRQQTEQWGVERIGG